MYCMAAPWRQLPHSLLTFALPSSLCVAAPQDRELRELQVHHEVALGAMQVGLRGVGCFWVAGHAHSLLRGTSTVNWHVIR